MKHIIASGQFTTEVYGDSSDLGHFVVIRQGSDMVMLPVADGDAEAKARDIAHSFGCEV